jgi:hypothetical protein
MELTVEFLGLSRRLAQVKECLVQVPDQSTLHDVVRVLATQFPLLLGPVIVPQTFELVSSHMFNIEGRMAAPNLAVQPQDGQRLILMFVEAGG